MNGFLIHLPYFRVVVCKKCQCAVLPSQIEAHFIPRKPTGSKKPAKQIHGIGKELCMRIKNDIDKIEGLIRNPEHLKQYEFSFPPSTIPIPVLGSPETNGLQCTFKIGEEECGYICCPLQYMQRHCELEHQWKCLQKGRPKKGVEHHISWRQESIASVFSSRDTSHSISKFNPFPPDPNPHLD